MNLWLAEKVGLCKAPQMWGVREEEVRALRNEVSRLKKELEMMEITCQEARLKAFQETAELRVKLKECANRLSLLSQAVLAGEYEKAEELAHEGLSLSKLIYKNYL